MNQTSSETGTLAEVATEPAGDQWTLIFTRRLRHRPPVVWSALTEPDQLAKWAPYTSDRTLAATGPVQLTMIDSPNPADAPGTVTHVHEPTLLEYTWGSDVLRWELAATESGTTLTLRHTLAQRTDAPKMAAGWHLCLGVAEHLLDGDPVAPIRGVAAMDHGWSELRDAYAEQLDR